MKIFILTGAGISAESGIKTFRDSLDGLWNNYRIEDVCSIEGFENDPNTVIDFHNQLQTDMNSKEPNDAHYAITEFMKDTNFEVTVVTQNIDGLHEKAGANCLHMHGNINEQKCLDCGEVSYSKSEISDKSQCWMCKGNNLRPNVVWFGEMPYHMVHIEEKLKECDIFISVGTSGTVYPAAGFSKIAKNKRAYTINVNISKSHSWNFKEEITGPASTALKKLLDKIKSGHYDEIVKERKKKKRAVS